jgi:hypothetical protein
MPTIRTFGRVKITMYYGDHGVPHFHVIAPDFKVSIAIETLEVLAGTARPRQISRGDRVGKAEPGLTAGPMGATAAMRQPRIQKVAAEDGARLRLHWIDGSTSIAEVSELIERLEGLAPLREPLVFATARVGDFGWAVAWSDDLDIGADTLFRLAVEQKALRMDGAALSQWRRMHELTQQRAANVLGLSLRQYYQFESGARPIPQTVALACSGFDAVSMNPAA